MFATTSHSLSRILAGFPLSAVEDFGMELNHLFRRGMEFLVKVKCNGSEYALFQCALETVVLDPQTTDIAAVQCIGESEILQKNEVVVLV